MSKDEWFSAGRVGGEALGDRGGEARLVDDGEVAGLVTFNDFYFYFLNDGLVTFNDFLCSFHCYSFGVAQLNYLLFKIQTEIQSEIRPTGLVCLVVVFCFLLVDSPSMSESRTDNTGFCLVLYFTPQRGSAQCFTHHI